MPGIRAGCFVICFMNHDPANFTLNLRTILMSLRNIIIMSPFQVQDQTKAMVMDNIVYLLNQFLAQACFDHVLFSWVMDQPETVQQIYNRLQGNFTFYHFTLLPSSTQLRRQLQQDIDRGLRTADCIPQSLSRLTHYDLIESEKIKINGQSPETITREILSRLK